MSRTARKKYNSKYFHVITQGINKEYIFKKKEYKEKYKELFISNAKDNEIKILSYCIMDNHTHMLLHCKNIEEMSSYMHKINTTYAFYYNKNEGRVGYVFRDRFYSEPIQDERHLKACVAYIHNNPVKAKMVNDPLEYEYSSYRDYINKNGIVTEEVLRIIFDREEKYIDEFINLHKISDEYEFIDINKKDDYSKYLKSLAKMDIAKLKESEDELKSIIKDCIVVNKIPKTELAKVLKISRDKIYKILKLI